VPQDCLSVTVFLSVIAFVYGVAHGADKIPIKGPMGFWLLPLVAALTAGPSGIVCGAVSQGDARPELAGGPLVCEVIGLALGFIWGLASGE